jgi:hypothetical protein
MSGKKMNSYDETNLFLTLYHPQFKDRIDEVFSDEMKKHLHQVICHAYNLGQKNGSGEKTPPDPDSTYLENLWAPRNQEERHLPISIWFENWWSQDNLSEYCRLSLEGKWKNSSGCWDETYIKIWYNKHNDTTFVHFPRDDCFTWEHNQVSKIENDLRVFINTYGL